MSKFSWMTSIALQILGPGSGEVVAGATNGLSFVLSHALYVCFYSLSTAVHASPILPRLLFTVSTINHPENAQGCVNWEPVTTWTELNYDSKLRTKIIALGVYGAILAPSLLCRDIVSLANITGGGLQKYFCLFGGGVRSVQFSSPPENFSCT